METVSERHPELWTVAASAGAWVILAARARGHVHYEHLYAHAVQNWQHWMIMVAAMMLPLQIRGIRLTAERSLWSRRHRAVLGYLLGYLFVWGFSGVPLAWGFSTLGISHRISWMDGAAVGFLVLAAWLVSPWKKLAARMCDRSVPLSPTGWRADRDCLTYGCVAGYTCALNCWPLMLVCWLSAHSFITMIVGFGLGWIDRHLAPNYWLHAIAAAMLGLGFSLLPRLS